MQKRFVSWAAVSSLPQAKKISLSDQLATNKEHVARWDGLLVEELVVPGESRSIVLFEDAARKIEAYAKLKDLIDKRAFDVFIYLDRSRLGRESTLSMAVTRLCQKAGILTYATESPPSALEIPESNFHNQVVGALESVLAQEEIVKIQHRHEMGMAARVRGGNFPGKIPYGWSVRYEVEGDRPVQVIEVDDQAKYAIEVIYDLYLNSGFSVKAINVAMKDQGFAPPRGADWTESAVTVILSLSMRYAGIVELNVRSKKRPYVRAKSRWPALIDEELAKKVTAERDRRAVAKRAVGRSVHLFTHVVWCKRCESKMIAHFGWRPSRRDGGGEKRVENYRCTHAGVPRHDKYQITNAYLVEEVRRAIEWIQVEANRESLLASYADKTPKIRQQIERAKARLRKHEEAIQRADDAYVSGNMSLERYQRQVENLTRERAKIDSELHRLNIELEDEIVDSQRGHRLTVVANEGLIMLDSGDIPSANAWFRRHVKIWVDNENPESRIEVEFI